MDDGDGGGDRHVQEPIYYYWPELERNHAAHTHEGGTEKKSLQSQEMPWIMIREMNFLRNQKDIEMFDLQQQKKSALVGGVGIEP